MCAAPSQFLARMGADQGPARDASARCKPRALHRGRRQGSPPTQVRPDARADLRCVHRSDTAREPKKKSADPLWPNTKGHSGEGSLLHLADIGTTTGTTVGKATKTTIETTVGKQSAQPPGHPSG